MTSVFNACGVLIPLCGKLGVDFRICSLERYHHVLNSIGCISLPRGVGHCMVEADRNMAFTEGDRHDLDEQTTSGQDY